MDFFKVAIDIERMVENHYRNLAEECSGDRGITTIMTMLADDHKKHRISFQQMKNEENVLPLPETPAFSEAKEVFSEIKKKQEPYTCDVNQVTHYKKALELVKHKVKVYNKALKSIEDDAQKKVLERIIAEEKKQEDILRNIIEMVNRPKTWLEDAEVYHLDEY